MLKFTEEKIYFQVFWSTGACIYETGIMNTYLNAVKDQYESGEKRMD